MFKIILTILFILQFLYCKSQIIDSDNDGIKDEEDACPKIAGIIDSHGCPGISKEEYAVNNQRQLKQFTEFENNFNFKQLSSLITQKLKIKYFEKSDIILLNFRYEEWGNDISSSKPKLPLDDVIFRQNLTNNLWNKENFENFMKTNSSKKIVLVQSLQYPDNIFVNNFEHQHNFIKKFESGKVLTDKKFITSPPQELFYYNYYKKTDNKSLTIGDDVYKYSGLAIYLSHKNNFVKADYYYNFKIPVSKFFKFEKGKWQESSLMEFEKLN
ncbi:hypothetical protein LNP04_00200 [Chryseobacterium sp. C-71]|uniref:hypothetical protein n=1 Tax=Chryseobacterium sp. C-71 TaxID=2893882 RepID=UPI001E615D76|nr:hypothetical protein [Chryseobacterium sp. C-71]UFH32157.1 hypothetical protein LNP04_00200 [Chryseobacterium sp. C-71]